MGSACARQDLLVAAMIAVSLATEAFGTASPVPSMGMLSCATHLNAGTVKGEHCHWMGWTVPKPCATAPRCLDGFYGDPTPGLGQQCWLCLYPGHPDSSLYCGSSCHVDSMSGHALFFCLPGCAGLSCNRCSCDYFGHLWQGGDPRRVNASTASAAISISMILLPVTPTVGTASILGTTAMSLAVLTASLAATAVTCVQRAASVSLCVGPSQGDQVGFPLPRLARPSSPQATVVNLETVFPCSAHLGLKRVPLPHSGARLQPLCPRLLEPGRPLGL
ncbi:Laminin subunit beta-1 [Plecturocebus cupreus]